MRKVGLGVVLLLSISVGVQAEVFRTRVQGTGTFMTFSDVSSDGCVVTNGQLAVLSTNDGTQALTIIERWDYCAPDGPAGFFYGGGGEAAFAATALSSASASGTIVADEYTGHGLPPVTVEFSLALTGTGAVNVTTQHFASGGGGVTLSVSAQRSRAANASGSLTVDGDAETVAGAQLIAETAGELVVVH